MVTGVFQFPSDFVSAGPAAQEPYAETFISGGENWMLEHTLNCLLCTGEKRPVGANPIAIWGPIVIWGPSGTGKTMILHGVASCWARQRPEYQVLAMHAADWARGSDTSQSHDDARHTANTQSEHAFSENSNSIEDTVVEDTVRPAAECSAAVIDQRRPSALFLDDVHQLAGRAAAQVRLIHVLDQISQSGGQTLLTCRSHPAATPGLSARLVSRLMGGLPLEIHAPGQRARAVIVQEFARRVGWKLAPEAANFAAETISGSVRELRQALARCFPVRPLSAEAVGIEQIRPRLKAWSQDGISPQDLIALVARHYRVTAAALKSASRRRNVVLARSVAMAMLRQTTKMPLKKIGDLFGGRDHTTVIHACRKIEQQLTHDAELNQFVSEATTNLRLRNSC